MLFTQRTISIEHSPQELSNHFFSRAQQDLLCETLYPENYRVRKFNGEKRHLASIMRRLHFDSLEAVCKSLGVPHLSKVSIRPTPNNTGLHFYSCTPIRIKRQPSFVTFKINFPWDALDAPNKTVHLAQIGFKNFLQQSITGYGVGTRVVASMIRTLTQSNFSALSCIGERSPLSYYSTKELNGYYTWARMGFDANLSSAIITKLNQDKIFPLHDSEPKSLLDLMEMPAGRQWWKTHGMTMGMSFDLRPNSRSNRVLTLHQKEKGIILPEYPFCG